MERRLFAVHNTIKAFSFFNGLKKKFGEFKGPPGIIRLDNVTKYPKSR